MCITRHSTEHSARPDKTRLLLYCTVLYFTIPDIHTRLYRTTLLHKICCSTRIYHNRLFYCNILSYPMIHYSVL